MSANISAMTNKNEVSSVDTQAGALGNSDKIQLKFGNYGIDVLENGPGIRVSNLYSVQAGIKTNRTFAVVAYPAVIEPAFKKEHDAIISGQSIGIVFRNNGWLTKKHHQYFGKIDATSDFPEIFSVFDGIGSSQPAIHIYSLLVTQNKTEFQYALIAEVHHPTYLKLEDLQAAYGNEFDGKRVKTSNVNDFLKIVKTKMQSTQTSVLVK